MVQVNDLMQNIGWLLVVIGILCSNIECVCSLNERKLKIMFYSGMLFMAAGLFMIFWVFFVTVTRSGI